MKQRIKSTCVVELEIKTGDVWSDDTTMAQIIHQSRTAAEGRIRKLFLDAANSDASLPSVREGARGIRLTAITKVVMRCETEW